MAHTCVNTAAIRVQAADHHVIDPDQGGEHAHRCDEPERGVTGDGEREPDNISFARAPVTIKNRGRALPGDVARPLNVGWYHDLPVNEIGRRANLVSVV